MRRNQKLKKKKDLRLPKEIRSLLMESKEAEVEEEAATAITGKEEEVKMAENGEVAKMVRMVKKEATEESQEDQELANHNINKMEMTKVLKLSEERRTIEADADKEEAAVTEVEENGEEEIEENGEEEIEEKVAAEAIEATEAEDSTREAVASKTAMLKGPNLESRLLRPQLKMNEMATGCLRCFVLMQ